MVCVYACVVYCVCDVCMPVWCVCVWCVCMYVWCVFVCGVCVCMCGVWLCVVWCVYVYVVCVCGVYGMCKSRPGSERHSPPLPRSLNPPPKSLHPRTSWKLGGRYIRVDYIFVSFFYALLRYNWQNCAQLLLEQRRSELCRCVCIRISFNKYVLPSCTTCGWLNPEMWDLGYDGTAYMEV